MMPVATLPPVVIEIDGQPAGDALAHAVVAVRIRHAAGRPGLASVELEAEADAGVLGLPASTAIADGVAMRIEIRGRRAVQFAGTLRAVERSRDAEGRTRVRLLAEDRGRDLRRRVAPRRLESASVQTVAEVIAADHGMHVTGTCAGFEHAVVLQHGRSDFDLLAECAARAGGAFTIDGDELRLMTADDGPPAVAIDDASVLAWDVAVGPAAPAAVNGAGSELGLGEPLVVMALAGDSHAAPCGPHEMALGELRGGDESSVLGAAEAQRQRTTAAACRLALVVDGEAAPRVGDRILITGFVPECVEPFTVGAIEHVVSAEAGHLCTARSLMIDPPRPEVPSLSLGQVVDADDPRERGRVRVRLFSAGGLESDWLLPALAGAGADRGLMASPRVGDTVAVLLADSLLGRGVVLGGVYGPDDPPSGALNPDCITLATPAGGRLILDELAEALTIEAPAGGRIAFDDGGTVLHSERDLVIEAPGQRIRICADQIDFVRG